MRRTALHWACQGGFVRIVELLIDHGADTKVSQAELLSTIMCPSHDDDVLHFA